MLKSKTIKKIGYKIEGTVSVNHWGGGNGEGDMQPFAIFHSEFTEEDLERVIPQGLNDNGFGVESFNWAIVDVYELYEYGVKDYMCEMQFDGDKVKFGCGFFEEGLNARMLNE